MRKKFIILMVIFFVQGIATNMHHPLMPRYVEFLDLPAFMVGLFFALMNFGTMLGGPFWGNLGDQGKKKIVVILGFTIYGSGQLLFGLGHLAMFNQYVLGVFRFASGFGIAAATTIIMSEIILVSKPVHKSRNIAYGVAILALGGALGYLLGGKIFFDRNIYFNIFSTPFANILFIQMLMNFGLALAFGLIYKPVKIERPKDSKRTYFWDGFKEIKNIPASLLFFLISLSIITIAATNVDKYLELYLNDLGFTPGFLGEFKMIVGLVSIFVTLTIVPLIMKIKKRILVIGILQLLSGIIVFIVFRSNADIFMVMLYTVYMLYIIIKAIFSPLEQDFVASYSNDSNVSMTMGIRQSFYSIGTIIGPVLGGALYGISASVLFNFSAILFIVSLAFLLITQKLQKKESKIDIQPNI